MKNFLHSLLFIVFLLILSCQNDNKNTFEKASELSFAIDNNLLGTAIIDLNQSLSYSVPKFWLNSDSSKFSKLFEFVNYEKNNLNIILHLKNVFADSNTKSYLVVSELKSETNNFNLKMLNQEITELLKVKFDSASFKKALFTKDGIEVLQFLLIQKESVNFKLIFLTKNNKFLQFDYFISLETYINEIKSVESSIGSIVYF
jgi:hypothetical protein